MTAEKRTSLYMAMAWMGTLAIALFWFARLLDWPDFLKGLPIGMLLVSLAVLLRRKMRDEYVQRLWVAETSLSFVVVVLCFLAAPFTEEMLTGLLGNAADRAVPAITAPLALLAFFVGFLATWAKDRL